MLELYINVLLYLFKILSDEKYLKNKDSICAEILKKNTLRSTDTRLLNTGKYDNSCVIMYCESNNDEFDLFFIRVENKHI